ncbi:lysoplasmalogenase [Lacihabitans sp. LS3-19]|uniref:lysoplasmalogenase n=1 Tax=Lacihabitans sp. LS3-19 TaxID=2487335 RepID=UPI0020CE952D|nr:lysoplasmalogenase [Lacihabitans sp. LS3-19]
MLIRILYFLILVLEIFFSQNGDLTFVKITKPLLMPLLMILAIQSGIKDKFLYIALFFSLLGDVFLMYSGQNYFMLGLGSFLIGHFAYILLFKKQFRFNLIKSLPFAIATFLYFMFLKRGIPNELFVAVTLYCSVITLMAIFAACRISNAKSYQIVLLGAILFVISDSLIAYNKFYESLKYSSVLVMSTYGVAQYLIVTGWAKKN